MKVIEASYELLTPIDDLFKLESSNISVMFVCDRYTELQLIDFAYNANAQYFHGNDSFDSDKGIVFVWPYFFGEFNDENIKQEAATYWRDTMLEIERRYFHMIHCGCSPQECLSIIPNSIKAGIIISGNFYVWRHFFNFFIKRRSMQTLFTLAEDLLVEFDEKIPNVFHDILVACSL